MRNDDRERAAFFFFRTNVVLRFVDPSAIYLTSLALKGANHVRGGVLKSTLVVDNVTVYIHSMLSVS